MYLRYASHHTIILRKLKCFFLGRGRIKYFYQLFYQWYLIRFDRSWMDQLGFFVFVCLFFYIYLISYCLEDRYMKVTWLFFCFFFLQKDDWDNRDGDKIETEKKLTLSAPCLQCVSVQWREHDATLQPGCVFWPKPDKRGSRWWCGHPAASDQRPGEEHHPPAWKHLPQPKRSTRAGVWEMHDTGPGWLVRENMFMQSMCT